MSNKSYNLKWVPNPKQQGDSKMKYVYTRTGEKKPAGDVVDSLVREFMADQPTESYETGLKKVLALHENQALSEAYGRSPAEMI